MRTYRSITGKALFIICAFVLLGISFGVIQNSSVQAATLTVTNTDNSGPGSLRQAVLDADPGDTIEFDPSLSGATITLLSQITIDKDLTIDGVGLTSQVKISGGNSVRVFQITGGVSVLLKSLTIQDGNESSGGGVYLDGGSSLNVDTCLFNTNEANVGGGIYNEGNLFVKESYFNGNTTSPSGGGGGLFNFGGQITVYSSSFSDNVAGYGGAIDNLGGGLTIIDSGFTNNQADEGGAIRNLGVLSVSESYFNTNSATLTGGGIDTRSSDSTIEDTEFVSNDALNSGGAIYTENTLTVTRSSFWMNIAGDGGGVDNDGSITVLESNFYSNEVTGTGGGIRNTGPSLAVSDSYFSGNVAQSGAGLWNDDSATLSNSTLRNNDADDYGGGVYNSGTLTISGCTIFHNGSGINGGAVYNHSLGDLQLKNSILADSPAGLDCVNDGTLTTNTGNLIEDNTCSPALHGDPLLGSAEYNGGYTKTQALESGSPAIDGGDGGVCESTDQRGAKRPQGAGCDIGAYERGTQSEVNSTGDMGDGICDLAACTLREAVSVARSGDTINFHPSLDGGTIILGAEISLEKDLTIDGINLTTPITISGGSHSRVFHVVYGADVAITQLEIIDGSASAGVGGGIKVEDGCHVEVTNSTLSGHHADSGGAIFNEGTLNISKSTLTNNQAISYGGSIGNNGNVFLTNSTIVDNLAGQHGGGIYNYISGILDISGSTISDNSTGAAAIVNSETDKDAYTGVGGGICNSGTMHLKNTILANSPSGGDCYNTGSIATNLGNLIEDGSCSPDFTGDPLLGALTDNGGLTWTMALLDGSPAIDAGDDGLCESVDQRGVSRPQGAHCDIGAYERAQEMTVADFDGDGDTDLSVFKVESWGGMWYLQGMAAHGWGNSDSVPVPRDYDGDGSVDVAVYNDGTWYIKDQFVDTWGDASSVPVPGDYDGGGTTDLAVFKVEAWGGMWYLQGMAAHGYGNSESIPVPGDYDGDGTTDVAVYNDGTWYVKDQFVDTWGDADSIPVPGDYDGDGTTDLAVFKVEPWGGMWYIKDQTAYGYGNSESIPVPGDYDGDGITDVAVYNDGTWYVKGQFVDTWGDAASYPLPAPDTNGDGDPYQ